MMSLFVIFLVGCSSSNDKIPYPENIRLFEETILWDEVSDATSYSIKINDSVFTILDTSFSLESFPNGNYDIRIRSHKGDVLSYFSPAFKIMINRSYETFEFITLVNQTIYFPEIDGISSYALYQGELELTTFENNFIDLSTLLLPTNQLYQFRIAAIYPTTDKVFSDVVLFHTYVNLDILVETTFDHALVDHLDLQLNNQFTIDYILYGNEIIDPSLYQLEENMLTLDHDAFHPNEEGTHYMYILTASGFITIKVNVINQANPRISSSDSVLYAHENLTFTFELQGGTFVGLSGNTITGDDYVFINQNLTIYATYVERLLLENPSRQTIILVYQLSKNSNITMGFIFINIPQD